MKISKFLLSCLSGVIIFIFLSGCSSDNTIYVSETGNDANPGTSGSPLASLNRAMEIVHKSRLGKGRVINKVIIREGVYYLSETLQFDHNDSGTKKQALLFSANDNEKVTISGAVLLECHWELYRDGIYKSRLKGYKGEGFDQLFVNGKRQVRARFPNGDSKMPDKKSFIYPLGADEWPHSKIFYDPDTFTKKKWKRPEEAIIHIFSAHHWGNLQYRISDVNYDEKCIYIKQRDPQINETLFGMWDKPATWIDSRSNYFIDNVFEELDTEGEWYFDNKERVLYYKPRDNLDIETAVFEVPVLKKLVRIAGTKEHPVKNIEFKNIRFTGTRTSYMDKYEYPSMGDWGIVRNGAVFIEGAEDITVSNCFFDAVGGTAIFINNYAKSIHIESNIFTECGESAVCLVGKSHLNFDKSYKCKYCGAEHPWGWDKPSNEIPSECIVKNNIIHDIGVFGKQVAGVFLSITKNNTISHNHIYNTPRAGICINDGWHGGHIVEFNDIHHTVRETGDHGPFNSWGRERFWCHRQSHGQGASHPAGNVLEDAKYTTIIRNNRFTDNSGWGIDLDDGSSNYHVYNNLCIGVSIKLREGDYRIVENNIFYKGANPPSIHRGYENNHDIFRNNIVVVDSVRYNPTKDFNFVSTSRKEIVFHFISVPEKSKFIEVLDSNLYYTSSGKFTARIDAGGRDPGFESKYMNLAEWQKLGFDKHSIFADPLFADPENGDFDLPDHSRAFEIGFREFPLDRFGPDTDFKNIFCSGSQKH